MAMPTATDPEGHAITYTFVSATDTFVSYDATAKLFTFNPLTTTLASPVTISINARDGDVNSLGTDASFTI